MRVSVERVEQVQRRLPSLSVFSISYVFASTVTLADGLVRFRAFQEEFV